MITKITNAIFTKPGRWLVAGIAGTIILAIFMEGIARAVLGGPMKPAALICQALGLDASYLWLGEILHYGLGIIAFPIGYVAVLAITGMRSGIVTGAVWGIVLWVAAGTIMMTLAGQPLFFGFGKTMVASLVAHLAYGAVLGGVLNKASTQSISA